MKQHNDGFCNPSVSDWGLQFYERTGVYLRPCLKGWGAAEHGNHQKGIGKA